MTIQRANGLFCKAVMRCLVVPLLLLGHGQVAQTTHPTVSVIISIFSQVVKLPVNVGAYQSILATDILAGKLTFTPAANANGDSYASFGFQVSDGKLLSGTYTASLNVKPVRDDMDLMGTSGIDSLLGDQIWMCHLGNDLQMSVIGTSDEVTVQNWYSGNAYHVEQIKFGDGKMLQDTRVDALVQAMAGFAPPAMGETSLSAAYAVQLAPVLAASWA